MVMRLNSSEAAENFYKTYLDNKHSKENESFKSNSLEGDNTLIKITNKDEIKHFIEKTCKLNDSENILKDYPEFDQQKCRPSV